MTLFSFLKCIHLCHLHHIRIADDTCCYVYYCCLLLFLFALFKVCVYCWHKHIFQEYSAREILKLTRCLCTLSLSYILTSALFTMCARNTYLILDVTQKPTLIECNIFIFNKPNFFVGSTYTNGTSNVTHDAFPTWTLFQCNVMNRKK